jgi:hypothetical protein
MISRNHLPPHDDFEEPARFCADAPPIGKDDALVASKGSGGIREQLLIFLRRHPCNFTAAAKHLGLSRPQVMRIINNSKELFDVIEDEYLDGIEEQVLRAASGDTECRFFKLGNALKVLQLRRPDRWRMSKKVITETPFSHESGVAELIIRRYERRIVGTNGKEGQQAIESSNGFEPAVICVEASGRTDEPGAQPASSGSVD